MRTFILASLPAAFLVVLLSGCQNRADDCEETLSCGGAGGASGGSSSGTGSASGEGGEGGAGEVPSCDPSVEQCETELVVFVSPTGDDQAAGTKSAPLKTLGAAVKLAAEGAGVIWACADEGAFKETLTLGEGTEIELYGGLSCAGFEPVDAKTRIEAGSASGHQLTQVKSALLSGVHLSAPDAEDAGASSTALTVSGGGAVELKKSALTAGKGADGAAGLGFTEAAEAGVVGSAGALACVAPADSVNGGGPAVTTSCGGTLTASVGGRGGSGGGGLNTASGGAADAGAPATTTDNLGGEGESSNGAITCKPGGTGRAGTAGSHGAAADALGTLSSSGYAPSHGGLGKAGGLGEGGGGGGGAKKPTCATGASGGGGGSGGCGGDGAGGGQSGGASLGLVSVNAHVSLTDVTIKVAAGGAGGVGGDGQIGGTRGGAGPAGLKGAQAGATDACAGGPGGNGGDGGSGGGGAGGPTFGIAVIGDAPSQTEVLFTLPSSGAPGAAGGALNEAAAGPTGAVKQQQEF